MSMSQYLIVILHIKIATNINWIDELMAIFVFYNLYMTVKQFTSEQTIQEDIRTFTK